MLQTSTGYRHWYCLFFAFLILTLQSGYGQNITNAEIEKAIEENRLDLAYDLIGQQITLYYNNRQPDSINNYIFYTGKVVELRSNTGNAVKQVESLLQKIKTISSSPLTLRTAYIEAGGYFQFAGKNNLAYKANSEAYKYGLQVKGFSKNQLALSQNNVSTCAQRMGDINLSQKHSRQALSYLLSDPKPEPEVLYNTYNGMGNAMYYASRLDSAQYYFNKALETLKKTEPTIMNQYYRPAVIQNNLAGIYGVRGRPTEAITAMKSCINNLKLFIASKAPNAKKSSAISFQFEATDNLAGIYKEIGDYKQAHDLLTYSYLQKQKQLGQDDPAVFISEVLLGQLYYAMKEFDKSVQFLNSSLARMSTADGDHLFWHADACYTLAQVHDIKGNEEQAASFYEKADSLYEASLQGEYDNIYLEFLRNAALFYAENKMLPRGLAKANKGYNYIIKTEGTNSLLYFHQLLNFSEVHFASGNYKQALRYSNKALELVNRIAGSSGNMLDSVQVEIKKPRAILLKAKSEYHLLAKKDVAKLDDILEDLLKALQLLEKRKVVLSDPKDIGLMMADHTDLLEFIKKITLDLYGLTGNEQYVIDLVSLHESGIYNRIRSRLDKSEARFASLPAQLIQKEKTLKQAIANALNGDGTHDQLMQTYLQSVENWNKFLDQLRIQYPQYYKMRYGSIFKSISEIQHALPANTTVIRYFFVDKELLAYVVDKEQKQLFRLRADGLEKNIISLLKFSTEARQTGDLLHTLYNQLWLPVSRNIKTGKVIIIPDGILYKLNFEILTPSKINRLEELAKASLLSTHTISYQYSLFLLDQQDVSSRIENSYVAFVPGFSDEIKETYKHSRDSLDYDNSYLSLLPQPFTISLATKTQDLFGGNTYLYGESTLSSFKNNAGQHKIIYIGTHAEADNLHPEFSKLIFAKNTKSKDENNYLYLFDIYNCDLRSNLSVLTACETGVPGYEDGEGMISLAHAFNYAGSESIVMGLWKIDEKTSAVIMELFYKNLVKGMPKDEALRKAKLDYLGKAGGRTLSLQYWSGLVLIGNTTPITVDKKVTWPWFAAAGLVLLVAGAYYINRKKRMRIGPIESGNNL